MIKNPRIKEVVEREVRIAVKANRQAPLNNNDLRQAISAACNAVAIAVARLPIAQIAALAAQGPGGAKP